MKWLLLFLGNSSFCWSVFCYHFTLTTPFWVSLLHSHHIVLTGHMGWVVTCCTVGYGFSGDILCRIAKMLCGKMPLQFVIIISCSPKMSDRIVSTPKQSGTLLVWQAHDTQGRLAVGQPTSYWGSKISSGSVGVLHSTGQLSTKKSFKESICNWAPRGAVSYSPRAVCWRLLLQTFVKFDCK